MEGAGEEDRGFFNREGTRGGTADTVAERAEQRGIGAEAMYGKDSVLRTRDTGSRDRFDPLKPDSYEGGVLPPVINPRHVRRGGKGK